MLSEMYNSLNAYIPTKLVFFNKMNLYLRSGIGAFVLKWFVQSKSYYILEKVFKLLDLIITSS